MFNLFSQQEEEYNEQMIGPEPPTSICSECFEGLTQH